MSTDRPTMTPAEFKKFRLSHNFTKATMAEVLGVTFGAVTFWEDGERRIPEHTVRLIGLFKKYPQLISEF